MARTKTTPANPENHTSPEASSQSPPPNAANDQVFDHSPLNENPVHTILPYVIYPAFEKPKFSKPESCKKSIIKPKPIPTRRSQRMKRSLKEPKVSHVNLVSDKEKKTNSNGEEEESQETGQTLREMVKSARLVYKRRKVATSSLSAEKLSSPSQQNDEEIVETEEASRKRGKGKDIAIMASVLKAHNVECNTPFSQQRNIQII